MKSNFFVDNLTKAVYYKFINKLLLRNSSAKGDNIFAESYYKNNYIYIDCKKEIQELFVNKK